MNKKTIPSISKTMPFIPKKSNIVLGKNIQNNKFNISLDKNIINIVPNLDIPFTDKTTNKYNTPNYETSISGEIIMVPVTPLIIQRNDKQTNSKPLSNISNDILINNKLNNKLIIGKPTTNKTINPKPTINKETNSKITENKIINRQQKHNLNIKNKFNDNITNNPKNTIDNQSNNGIPIKLPLQKLQLNLETPKQNLLNNTLDIDNQNKNKIVPSQLRDII